jgi:hypothetical protein
MSHSASPLAAFHLIGDRSGLDSAEASLQELRPALFGAYHDLSTVRYDYPLVLITDSADGMWVKSLADIIDGVLREIAEPGSDGEEVRRQVLSMEQIIRSMLASGQQGSLSLFWEGARRRLVDGDSSTDEKLNANLQRAREALNIDGELVGCDSDMAAKLVSCAWQESERRKAAQLHKRVDRLAQKLSDILKVNYMHSPDAREAAQLENTMGSDNQSVFDFQAMARILRTAPVAQALPESRRARIGDAISVLRSQHFVPPPGGPTEQAGGSYRFTYDDGQAALTAFRERLPEMAALIRAISIAELEIENRYDESRHDGFFNDFDETRLGPGDFEMFPSYLVCLDQVSEANHAAIFEILRAGLPFKVVAQTDDILDDDVISQGRLSFGIRGQQLARMAMGLENVFVMQAANSSLYRLRESVLHGLAGDRPALFSIYSGTATANVSPYLLAAAATESRAFPSFVFDPAAGRGQAARFHLDGNPEPAIDWPAHALSIEDADHNSQSADTCFTMIDFIAADPRYTGRFACVPREDWSNEMVPAADFLEMTTRERAGKVPYALLIDSENILHRAIVDDRLVDAAQRCIQAWRSLQELGGINNSHAAIALAQAEQAWDSEKEQLLAQATSQPAAGAVVSQAAVADSVPDATPAAVVAAPEPVPAAVAEPEPSSDDPWIETIRCTTCNECTELNDRMFAYNEDMRAYVADPDAGTFRELVEAAETCQVAIIHPGKPRNPDEADLEELIERAEPFN